MAESVLSFTFQVRNADDARTAVTQLKDALGALDKEADEAGRSMERVASTGKRSTRAGGQDQSSQMAKGINDLISKGGGLGGIATKLLGVTAAITGVAAGAQAMSKVWHSAVQDMQEGEDAALRLGFAFQQAGKYSAGAVADFQAYADTLELTTLHSSEYVQQVASIMASLGKLSGDSLQRATKAVLDFSTLTGQSADQMARLISQIASTGEAAGLDRLRLNIDKSKRGAELMEEVLRGMEAAAKGVSEAAAGGMTGAFKIASEAAQNLAGDLGRAFNLDEVLTNAARGITDFVNAARGKLASLQGVPVTELEDFVRVLDTQVAALRGSVGATAQELQRGIDQLRAAFTKELELRVRSGDIDQLIADLDRMQAALVQARKQGSTEMVTMMEDARAILSQGLQVRLTLESNVSKNTLEGAIRALRDDKDLTLLLKADADLSSIEQQLDAVQKRMEALYGAAAKPLKAGEVVATLGVPSAADIARQTAHLQRDLGLEQRLTVEVLAKIEGAQTAEEVAEVLVTLKDRLREAAAEAERNSQQLGAAVGMLGVYQKARAAAAERVKSLPDAEAKVKLVTEDAQKDLDAFTKAMTTAVLQAGTPVALVIDFEQALLAADALDRVRLAGETVGPALEEMRKQGDVAGLTQSYEALGKALEAVTTGPAKDFSLAQVAQLEALRAQSKAALDALVPLQQAQEYVVQGRVEMNMEDFDAAQARLFLLRQMLAEDPLNVPLRLLVEQFEADLEDATKKAEEAAINIDQVMLENITGAGINLLSRTMDSVVGAMVGTSRAGANEITSIFHDMVRNILSELAKLAAAKLFKFLLSLVSGGAYGVVGGLVGPPQLSKLSGAGGGAGGGGSTDAVVQFTGQTLTQQAALATSMQLAMGDLVAATRELPTAASELVEAVVLAQRDARSVGDVYVDALEPSDFESYMLRRGSAVLNELARTGRL